MRKQIKVWFVAARPHTLSASLVPVLVGSALAAAHGSFAWILFILTVLGAVLMQIGANFTDEYADHEATRSAHKYLAPHKVIARGLLSHGAVRMGAAAVFGLATIIGSWLVWRTGWPLLAVCLISLAVAYAYSAGPLPLGDYGLGEVLVFLVMGPVMVGATYYVQTLTYQWMVLWVALPVGALVAAILVANNLRDEEEDRRGGRNTLATLFGARAVRAGYLGLLVLAYLCPVVLFLLGKAEPWLALPWITLPLALRAGGLILRGRDRDTLHRALKSTSALHLLYGAVLAVGLFADGMGRG
ncbi:MAG: 1,4-dihydroxy-2-naphthoate octaprenyltransferase [SAR324 cluster bacterium]|nr:1,4-dihydroxy-2-naphthoate octaprenyltransferase [SAR324 cluster bacterium]